MVLYWIFHSFTHKYTQIKISGKNFVFREVKNWFESKIDTHFLKFYRQKIILRSADGVIFLKTKTPQNCFYEHIRFV